MSSDTLVGANIAVATVETATMEEKMAQLFAHVARLERELEATRARVLAKHPLVVPQSAEPDDTRRRLAMDQETLEEQKSAGIQRRYMEEHGRKLERDERMMEQDRSVRRRSMGVEAARRQLELALTEDDIAVGNPAFESSRKPVSAIRATRFAVGDNGTASAAVDRVQTAVASHDIKTLRMLRSTPM
jgi:hypothetical protein